MKNLLYIGNKLSGIGKTPTSIEILGPFLEREGYSVRYSSGRKNKLARLAEMVWKTIRYARSTDFVLIDTYSTQNFWYAFVVSQLCRLLHVRYLPILHGGSLPARLEKNPRLCRMVFANSHFNIAPSKYLVEAFGKKGFDVKHIPNPIDLEHFKFKSRPFPKPRLLWVRSLAPIYNPEMAIYATAKLKEKHPDAELCMVGPDTADLVNRLTNLAEKLNVTVSFPGRLTKGEWSNLAEGYDFFLNTATVDNTPYSIIEALAMGMYVISTDVGGIPFILKHRKSAMLVKSGDADAMAKLISEVLEDAGLREILTSNSQMLAANSQWPQVRLQWIEILEGRL